MLGEIIVTLQKFAAGLLVIAAMLMSQVKLVAAQDSADLRVLTRQLSPFVFKDGDTYKGFSIDLWAAIAKALDKKYNFVEKANVKEVLAAIKAGEGDLGIYAISITAVREQEYDFSQPMFESGLQIMTRNDQAGAPSFWQQILPMITSSGFLFVLAILAALIIIPAHIAWYVENKKDNHLFPSKYFPGIFHSMYWATGAAAGQQPDPLYSGAGRFLSTILIIGSLFFTSYFTATITTSLTVQQLKSDINGPDDLAGRKVGTTTGSTAEGYLKGIGATPTTFDKIDEAIAALLGKQVDAVVFDAPVLLYYSANKGQGKVRMVGDLLRKENYGILFPRGSEMRKTVNEALLKLRENGTYDTIYAKWFTAAQSASP